MHWSYISAGKKAHKVCFIFFCITQLMGHFMCGYIRFQKTGNGCIHLAFAGKRIVITLETEIISQIAKKDGFIDFSAYVRNEYFFATSLSLHSTVKQSLFY